MCRYRAGSYGLFSLSSSYAAVAATVILTVATLSSVGHRSERGGRQRIRRELPERLESDTSLLPRLRSSVEMLLVSAKSRHAEAPGATQETRAIIAHLRFEKPFMPPHL